MSDIAIRVENLSKLYRIGARQERYKTLRDTLVNIATRPFRRLKQRARSQESKVGSSLNSMISAHSSSLPSTDGYIWALKDVSFEVKRGDEWFCL